MEKTALIQSSKTKTSFDVKLIHGNRSSTNGNNLLNTFLLLKTYEKKLNPQEILRISMNY